MGKYSNINIYHITLNRYFQCAFISLFFCVCHTGNRLGIMIIDLAFDSSQQYFRIIDVNDGSDWERLGRQREN